MSCDMLIPFGVTLVAVLNRYDGRSFKRRHHALSRGNGRPFRQALHANQRKHANGDQRTQLRHNLHSIIDPRLK